MLNQGLYDMVAVFTIHMHRKLCAKPLVLSPIRMLTFPHMASTGRVGGLSFIVCGPQLNEAIEVTQCYSLNNLLFTCIESNNLCM